MNEQMAKEIKDWRNNASKMKGNYRWWTAEKALEMKDPRTSPS